MKSKICTWNTPWWPSNSQKTKVHREEVFFSHKKVWEPLISVRMNCWSILGMYTSIPHYAKWPNFSQVMRSKGVKLPRKVACNCHLCKRFLPAEMSKEIVEFIYWIKITKVSFNYLMTSNISQIVNITSFNVLMKPFHKFFDGILSVQSNYHYGMIP